MKPMTSPTVETVDLLDLKLLPAWVKEPVEARNYQHYEGEEATPQLRRRQDGRNKRSEPKFERSRPTGREGDGRKFKKTERDRDRRGRPQDDRREKQHRTNRPSEPIMPPVTIRFLPYSRAVEHVVAQV